MQTNKVTLREKVGYSLGDVAANLVFQMMMIFQLKFYTDIFGLDGAVAGSVLLIARVVDAFVDPAVGIITDRTKTRWGKYRPWVLWTALPFCVFYVLAFWNPGIEDKGLVALYATISYVLLMTMYSFNNTPYSALGGVMTGDIILSRMTVTGAVSQPLASPTMARQARTLRLSMTGEARTGSLLLPTLIYTLRRIDSSVGHE